MYNPNDKNSRNPPPPAHNYGAASNHMGNNAYVPPGHGNNVNMNTNYNAYDIPGGYKDGNSFYEAPPADVTGNGGLYDEFSLNAFSSTKIRHGFIRKVYLLLSLQLLITFGFSLLATINTPLQLFVVKYYILFLVLSIVLTIPTVIALACYPDLGKKYPLNYILLFLVTAGMTCMVMLVTAVTKAESVYYALATTMAVTIGLTIFSFQTKYDFTGWYVYLFVAFLILLVIGIIRSFFPSKTFNLIYAGIGALLLSVAIVIDTQMIVGGKHKQYQFSIDDYIFAALTLYMDIVNLFLMILSIFSNASD